MAEGVIAGGLVLHAALTVFDNLPDAGRPIAHRIRTFGTLPQWRFFAPNPGIENFALVARRSGDEGWSKWDQIPIANRLSWYSGLWNPGGRGPKVLFDLTQQLLVTKSSGASYEWIRRSEPYRFLRAIVEDKARRMDHDGDRYQFMILSSLPNPHGAPELKPVMVSEEFALGGPA